VAGAVENAHLYRQMEHQARHDVLTGLPNRFYFEERLQALVGNDAAVRPALALLYVDLDRFKQINDTLGHRVGDLFLKQVARRFSGTLGHGRTLFRIGGDEFIVIAEGQTHRDPLAALASDMLASLQSPIGVDGHDLFANASIGISFCPADGETPSALQKHADIAMYRAKSLGPNHFEFYCAEMASRTEEALEIEQILRRTLEADSLELYYQPQFSMAGELAGFEALLRLPLPERLTTGPDRFIPVAEGTGLIVPVGKWVLREACRQAREWLDDGLALSRIAVNISAIEISRPTFADEVRDLLSSIPLDPGVLEIELTESAIMGNIAESSRQMRKLRALGVKLAIDDFGTGYSSLSYLHSLPIDTLKIDRSFVQAIRSPQDKSPFVEAIVALGRHMGLRIVAEGVETPAQLAALSGNGGCDFLQGYLLGRPGPAAGVRDLLRSSPSNLDLVLLSRAAAS
jgi:diguanylate cyclase (GGDEF)-like protein